MRGSMRRKGPSWELRVYLGRDPVSGRKRYATRNIRGPRRAADGVLRDMVVAAEAGATRRAGATLGELCETWLAHARSHLAANTVTETRRILDTVLLPALGRVPLAALRPEHLDDLYARLLRDGGRGGKPLAGDSVRRIHGVARRALTVGVRWGWIASNPAFVAMPPRTIRRPIQPPSPNEVAQLLEHADHADPDLATFLLLAATTGARRGELCGMRWHDLNPLTRQLDIVRTVIIVDGHCVEAPTKTRQARRVALDRHVVRALAAHRRRADRRAADVGVALSRDAYVFSHSPNGQTPWRPDSTTRAFRHLCRQIGLDGVRLHDLRHYVATTLLASGVDLRTVSGRLGHSKASTTLNVYAAFVPDADRRAAKVMSRLLDHSNADTHVSQHEVLAISQVRAKLSQLIAEFELHGIDAAPVVFGSRRRAQAVLISWELWSEILPSIDAHLGSMPTNAED